LCLYRRLYYQAKGLRDYLDKSCAHTLKNAAATSFTSNVNKALVLDAYLDDVRVYAKVARLQPDKT
jgi:hypothetical protein